MQLIKANRKYRNNTRKQTKKDNVYKFKEEG